MPTSTETKPEQRGRKRKIQAVAVTPGNIERGEERNKITARAISEPTNLSTKV